MRIAVLSDIHGNLPALEAVLASLRPYDAIWQLGDIVGYGPQPNEVVARLRARKRWASAATTIRRPWESWTRTPSTMTRARPSSGRWASSHRDTRMAGHLKRRED